MRSLVRLGCALLLLVPALMAQFTVKGEAPPPPPPPKAQVTVSDVIKMSNAGLSDDMIIQQIKKNSQPFDLTPDQLVRLKQNSVSERVIREMAGPVPPVAPLPSTAAPANNVESSEYPTEVGVYSRDHNKWKDFPPEVVNWKSAGSLRSVVTVGVMKQDLDGVLNGHASQLSLAQPAELLVVTREGVAITEYQLVRLQVNSDSREFRPINGGMLHVSGDGRDTLSFDWTKVAPRTYTIKLDHYSAGEYGILPPESIPTRGSAGSRGKLYTFHIGG